MNERWDFIERATKFALGCGLAVAEAAFWGARPATFTFIGTVLFGSELIRLVRKNGKDEK
jgi:hypothetical protein